MRILALVLIGTAMLALLRGGSLSNLAGTRFRSPWLLVAALAAQITAALVGLQLAIATYAAIGLFVLWNRTLPGILLAGIGITLNALVIAANGAMPVSAAAAEIAGVDQSVGDPGVKHEPQTEETRFAYLGDVLPVPVPLLRSVLSIGDIILLAGVGILVYEGMVDRRAASLPSA